MSAAGMTSVMTWALALLWLVAPVVASANPAQIERLILYVPGQPGGGYDRTATAIRDALIEERLANDVDLVRSPGAGGIVALAQFIEGGDENRANMLLVGGQSMLGSALFNRSTIALTDAVSVARMNSIALVVAVRADSPLRSWSDLADAMRQDPGALHWVGGSEGSVDEQLIRLIGNQLRISRDRIPYIPVPGGGASVADRVMAGRHLVAVSSYEELANHLADGRLRALAVSGERSLPNVAAPTFRSLGVGIEFSDWKGVFAVPGASAQETRRLTAIMDALARSPAWQRQLAQHGWQNNFLTGDDFAGFVRSASAEIAGLYGPAGAVPDQTWRVSAILERPYRWLLYSVGGAILVTVGLLLFMRQRQRHDRRVQEHLSESLADALEARRLAEAQTEAKLASISAHVERDFQRWGLSEAERDIGWLLLKGLSFKEIASLRKRSERTVRQQAGAIYAKAGLANRSELAAWFMEDFLSSGSEIPDSKQ